MSIKTAYLFAYNAAQALGWAAILGLTVLSIVENGSERYVYETCGFLVCFFQGVAFLETVHAATGLVRSGVMASFIQWIGRSHVLFAALNAIPELHTSVAVAPLFIAWAISEIIRYPWYATTLLDSCPFFLTYLRYTAFIVLYPIGVVSELWILVEALPIVKDRDLYSLKMPNSYNFGFDYTTFLVGVFAIYPFAFLQLYMQLLGVRGKKLHPKAKSS